MPNRIGLFEKRGQQPLGFTIEETTPLPPSNWEPPDLATLPDRLAGDIGFDTETLDHGLIDGHGPAWPWHGGKVVGYSIAADNWKGYLPIGHEGGGNLDPDQVRRWLNHVLSDETQTKIFANALYDIPWAANDGVKVVGPVIDIQLVEALLNEHRRSYSLENVALDRVGRGKNEVLLDAAAKAFNYDPKEDLWRLPSRYVGPYATDDSVLPRAIWQAQKPLIVKEGLIGIMNLEHALIPMYIDMRKRGVKVDLVRVEKLIDKLTNEIRELVDKIKIATGIEVTITEPDSMARLLDAINVRYDRTPKNNQPSITNELLKASNNPIALDLLEARQKDKLVGTFLKGQILEQHHNGRVHGSINPLKGDEGGTVTGRLSMNNPNLMFIPKRTDEGRLIRTCFVPEDGEEWAKVDYNQQEVRLLVHFSVRASKTDVRVFPQELRTRLATAMEAQRRFREDPKLDYHKMVAEFTGLLRDDAKQLNFAIIYGRGIAETARAMNISEAEAKALFDQHTANMPFARAMADAARRRVDLNGFVTTLLGRRQRFPYWEPKDWEKRTAMLPKEEARKKWPYEPLVRARIHKALNAVVQSSAADQTKRGMLNVWRSGYGKHIMIQVHDELDASVPHRMVAEKIGEIMRDAVKLEVQVRTDIEYGTNWGTVKKCEN